MCSSDTSDIIGVQEDLPAISARILLLTNITLSLAYNLATFPKEELAIQTIIAEDLSDEDTKERAPCILTQLSFLNCVLELFVPFFLYDSDCWRL